MVSERVRKQPRVTTMCIVRFKCLGERRWCLRDSLACFLVCTHQHCDQSLWIYLLRCRYAILEIITNYTLNKIQVLVVCVILKIFSTYDGLLVWLVGHLGVVCCKINVILCQWISVSEDRYISIVAAFSVDPIPDFSLITQHKWRARHREAIWLYAWCMPPDPPWCLVRMTQQARNVRPMCIVLGQTEQVLT